MKALGLVLLLVGALIFFLAGIILATLSRAVSGSLAEILILLLLPWAAAGLCGWGVWSLFEDS